MSVRQRSLVWWLLVGIGAALEWCGYFDERRQVERRLARHVRHVRGGGAA